MILYVDCSAGVSGDMLLAAFLSMGLPLDGLHRQVGRLGLGGVRLRPERLRREGVDAMRVSLRGSGRIPSGRAGDLTRFVEGSSLEPAIRRLMVRALTVLARAEGAVHGHPWREIHFHQLARADTLVNLAGLCAGLIHFRVGAVYPSPVPIGSRFLDSGGRWRRQPGPAVSRLLAGFPTTRKDLPFEWTTPTGAAFLAAFARRHPAPPFEPLRIGHGVGHGRPPTGPTVLRLLLARLIKGLDRIGTVV